jgi:uncharacterized protein
MQIDDSGEKGNVEDRRGYSPAAKVGGISAIVIGLVGAYLGINPAILQQFFGAVVQPQQREGPAPADGYKEFSESLLGNIDTVWREQFKKNGYGGYENPKMVLFTGAVNTKGCGTGIPADVGPFYCPADKTLYLDPTFFAALEKLGGSKAEFSQAYVVAHEVGHHVQNLLGYNDEVEKFRRSEGENAGIRLELQADYLAGVWAHHAQAKFKILSNLREVEDALQTASAIGDNKLTKGRVSSEKFNHGNDKQRYYFFKKGFETGVSSKDYLKRFMSPSVKPLEIGPQTGF